MGFPRYRALGCPTPTVVMPLFERNSNAAKAQTQNWYLALVVKRDGAP
jgi:hypothetical protein